MQGRRVLLVGGGNVAHEKIGKLVDASADVTVVAPALIEPVRAIVEEHGCTWLARPYESGDVEGHEVVMVATDDGEVNAQVAAEARALGIWVNAADDVANCDFILPSLAQRGRIALAASTGGASPALARWLRERLEEFLDDEVVALGDLLAEVRVLARQRDRECAGECDRTRTPPPLLCAECPNRIASDAWQDAIDAELRALLCDGQYEAARDRIVTSLGLDQPRAVPEWQGQPA
ncbi:MAG: bifunctional precorrin-2 dehydrogenase/sirohydrochlorin ferrochelatase [Chloroflexi bacterium]|nr:bifunctional precorrin-2 dehydrogenase/sirohydrochlorin ferrochelatase [Chloroflexota bacterium]